ncbi:MAG: DUF1003 domain-containing protein [Proteobacteria bacterium]|nr:DUF1003 domain-containing protein [Pseudomonadota bacterium]
MTTPQPPKANEAEPASAVKRHAVSDSGFKSLSQEERRSLAQLIRRARVSRNVHSDLEGQRSLGERLSDAVAAFGGSWTFIIIFSGVLLSWCLLNTVVLAAGAFDPYPYVFLNLVLSTIAAVQAPIIMMSQNRQASRDRVVQQHDYEVNLKAEIEIMALHEKMDELRLKQFGELLTIQQRQIEMLTHLIEGRKT